MAEPGQAGRIKSREDQSSENAAVLRVFSFLMLEIILATVLFFAVLGIAVVAESLFLEALEGLGLKEDTPLQVARRAGKLFLLLADGLIVVAFVTKGVYNAYLQTWGKK